jgi:hypothetical protein
MREGSRIVPDHYVAWWNVENLFDLSSSTHRPPTLKKRLKSELKGWTALVLKAKVRQLASIITHMNDGLGPDILGVCEVENEPVLNRLVAALAPLGRNYRVAHEDSSDKRGIDIAFIYDADRYTAEKQFHYEVVKRSATRDIFQVNFRIRTKSKRLLVLIGNHWPSRLGEAAYRIIAGETLSYWIQRIHEVLGGEPLVVVMGDFNDEPFSPSLTDFALSTEMTTKVLRARNERLHNLMWPLMGQGVTSYVYSGTPTMLDQFMVTRGMLRRDAPIKPLRDSVSVLRFPEMVSRSVYKTPRRFGRPSSRLDRSGFSDHYPIAVMLREVE